MGSGGVEIGVAQTAKCANVVVVGVSTVKHEVWCVVVDGSGGSYIEEVCGSVKGFYPKFGGHAGLDKECAKYVVCGADGALSFPVLW